MKKFVFFTALSGTDGSSVSARSGINITCQSPCAARVVGRDGAGGEPECGERGHGGIHARYCWSGKRTVLARRRRRERDIYLRGRPAKAPPELSFTVGILIIMRKKGSDPR
jgi:hypothetical protein